MKKWDFTNRSKPSAVGSPRSVASRSELAISEGNVRSKKAIAPSCDNHLTSLASFSLMAGSSSSTWIACSPDNRLYWTILIEGEQISEIGFETLKVRNVIGSMCSSQSESMIDTMD